ncbi:MAG: GxxExxY protein [Bacteroidales bacterium]
MTQREVNNLAYKIVGCAIEVHRQLGPGLLESIYEKCLVEELTYQGFSIKQQVNIPITYKSKTLDCELRLDLLINDCIIVELKAVEELNPLYQAQLLTYLRLLKKPKGLLINFNCINITDNMIPLVTEEFAKLKKE